MNQPVPTPQQAAVEQYRRSERSLRTMARWAIQAGDLDGRTA